MGIFLPSFLHNKIKKRANIFIGFLLIFIIFGILETSKIYNDKKSSKIALKMKSFKNKTERSFTKNEFKRAKNNFCLINYKRIQSNVFNLQRKLEYYTPKCGFEQKTIFYGFQNGKLVEIVTCQFYVYEQKWTFEEFIEQGDYQGFIEERKLELYSFENHLNFHQKIRFVL